MNDLRTFQLTVAKALVGLGFVHVPMLAVIGVLLGRDAAASAVVALALALAPAALLYAQRSLTTVAFGITIALVGQTSLLVLLFEGHPWQVEMHFYYFVVLAMLSGFCDWRVLVLAAGLVSLHHLTLNFVLPAAVYPGGSDLLRVAVHALFVVIEVTMLTFIGQTIRRAFFAADQARRAAEETAVELENIGSRREQYLIATSRRVEVVGGLLDKFKSEMTKSIDVLRRCGVRA
jgi:methyl-accepting chemotaxis protein